ncbi:MAG: hypothetical protein LBT48_07955 [Prevotellaceae bacterium]|jgi:hypothetical protein|nr:hypothetical protein [Prevotellaceae bacterium]
MKKVSYIILTCSILLSVSSCEWINTSILRNPSKAELARKKIETARQDSIAKAEQARLDSLQQQEQQQQQSAEAVDKSLESQRYHVVFGCFGVPANAERMTALLESKGYSPTSFHFRNGLSCISAQSFSDIHSAYNAMDNFLNTFQKCPEDIWVYDAHSGLHQ